MNTIPNKRYLEAKSKDELIENIFTLSAIVENLCSNIAGRLAFSTELTNQARKRVCQCTQSLAQKRN